MQTSLIILLALCMLLAAYGYYFGFIRPTRILAWLNQAGFVFMTFVMVPILMIALWLQHGAEDRLARTGFIPHPAIIESVGVAVGKGENPKWVFKIDATKEVIEEFYRVESNREGWEHTNDDSVMLTFKKGNEKMVIGVYKGWTSNTLIYMLTKEND